jgi:hypothetical protein
MAAGRERVHTMMRPLRPAVHAFHAIGAEVSALTP